MSLLVRAHTPFVAIKVMLRRNFKNPLTFGFGLGLGDLGRNNYSEIKNERQQCCPKSHMRDIINSDYKFLRLIVHRMLRYGGERSAD
jgi:hypothetical protein